jgi:glutamate-1-semialdehyde 2,1-aminomutase
MSKKNSEEIYKQACEVLTGGVSRNTIYRKPYPNYAEKASGCRIIDIDGTERFDFANNMASLIHGHAHPAIIKAVAEQLHKGTAYSLASEIEVAFAQLLCSRVKGFEKIRFVNSGTEAVMAMIKTSRAFTGRPKIAKAEGTYHGKYDFAEISQVSDPSNWGELENPNSIPMAFSTPQGVLDNVVIFPFNDIDRTLSILDKHAGQIACVMIDPVPLRVGLIPATNEFIEAVYQWTRKNGALLAFDEVVSFRTNYGGAQQNYSVRPDITALGKIIGGGFPVGAFAGRSDVMKVMDPREPNLKFPYSGTFSANPISMTAGYVAMDLLNGNAIIRLNEITSNAIEQIKEVISQADVPVSITVAGSMFRFHFTPIPPSSFREAYQSNETVAVINELLDFLYCKERILLMNTFACAFSTVITQSEIDILSEGLFRAFTALKPKIEGLQK